MSDLLVHVDTSSHLESDGSENEIKLALRWLLYVTLKYSSYRCSFKSHSSFSKSLLSRRAAQLRLFYPPFK